MSPANFCSRKHKAIKAVLRGWGVGVVEQIVEVSIDLSGNYRGLVQKLMPDANIIADRFQVMKLVREELNTALIKVKKAHELNLYAAEKARYEAAFKQSKCALLKPEESLTEGQRLKLAEVQAVSPLVVVMHRQKEAFRNTFETAWD